MNRSQLLSSLFAVVVLPCGLAAAKPEKAMSLAKIVEALERKDYGPFIELERDADYWEIEVLKAGAAVELHVDRFAGEVISEHRDDTGSRPPKTAKPLSQLLKQLQSEGHETIREISFERRYWEIESELSDGKHELHVDPLSGAIVSDRIDD